MILASRSATLLASLAGLGLAVGLACQPSPTVGPEPAEIPGIGGVVAGPGNGGVFPADEQSFGARCTATSDKDKKVITLRSDSDGYVFSMLLAADWTVVCNADTMLDARSDFLGMVVRAKVSSPATSRGGQTPHLKEIALREMRTMGEAGMPIKDIQFRTEPVNMATYFIDVPDRGRAINIWVTKKRADGMMVELNVSYLPQPSHPAWLRDDPVGGLAPLLETFELLDAAPEVEEPVEPAPDTVERPTVERPNLGG